MLQNAVQRQAPGQQQPMAMNMMAQQGMMQNQMFMQQQALQAQQFQQQQQMMGQTQPVPPVSSHQVPQYDYSLIPENQRAAVMQLMQFTDAQIAALPQMQQQQIMGLKAHLTRK